MSKSSTAGTTSSTSTSQPIPRIRRHNQGFAVTLHHNTAVFADYYRAHAFTACLREPSMVPIINDILESNPQLLVLIGEAAHLAINARFALNPRRKTVTVDKQTVTLNPLTCNCDRRGPHLTLQNGSILRHCCPHILAVKLRQGIRRSSTTHIQPQSLAPTKTRGEDSPG